MPKLENLTGQIFGQLTVLETVKIENERAKCLCQCSCGSAPKYIASRHLKQGKIKSCGCLERLNRENIGFRSLKDLLGKRFGLLQVIKKAPRNLSFRCQMWECLCDCGNIKILPSSWLGIYKSCGCLLEKFRHNFGTFNARFTKSKTKKANKSLQELKNAIRKLEIYKEWRSAVFNRDNYACLGCANRQGVKNAHHLIHFKEILKKYNIQSIEEAAACAILWDTNNGITLCEPCHKKLHKEGIKFLPSPTATRTG